MIKLKFDVIYLKRDIIEKVFRYSLDNFSNSEP